MTEPDLTDPATAEKQGSQRRDWILLPAVGLFTIALMAVSAEALSRWFYPVTQVGFQNCFATADPTGDAPAKPNSVCYERTAESPVQAEYKFNSRGHRAGTELTPKAPGTYRIVLIGSSMTQGLFVPREKTFAALLPAELSEDTGRKVEVYNEATGGKFRGGPYPTQNSPQQFGQVLAAQPDLVLWVITPTDIINAEANASAEPATGGVLPSTAPSTTASAEPRHLWNKITAAISNGTFGDRLKARWEETRTSVVLKHLLIASESQDEYIRSFISNGANANFLKITPDSNWHVQQQNFEIELNGITGSAKSAGIPLVAAFVPNRPLAAMLSRGDWPSGYNPFKVDCEVRQSILQHGGSFIDILGDYRRVPGPERDYFPVDGHPDAAGHATIARLISRELTSGKVPELKASTPRDVAPEPCG